MTSQLTNLKGCKLHRRTPYGMTGVSQTQFSIARHCGGIQFNGDQYTYLPATDELIRADVLRWKNQQDRKARKVAKAAKKDTTPELI